MADNVNETVQVDDGAVVHTTESEAPTHAETHHVLSEDAQAIIDKIQSVLTANFDRKLAGSVLTAEMYNKMNDMFVNAHNKHDVSVEALKQYILQFLPNFVDVYLNEDINEANPLVGTITNGLLVIDLRSVLSDMLTGVYQDGVKYTDEQIEAAKELLTALSTDYTDAQIAITKNTIANESERLDTEISDLHKYVDAQDTTVLNDSKAYVDKRLEGSESPLVALTKEEIDTLIAGGSISDDYTEEFLAEEISISEIDAILNS